MEGLRSIAKEISNMMSLKMIIFAVLGLIVVVGVNILFYKEMKKTFKERKLIWKIIFVNSYNFWSSAFNLYVLMKCKFIIINGLRSE